MDKCAIYLRVSTKDQSVENQLPQLIEFAKSQRFEVAEIYSEQESAWRAGHQRELARLLDDLRGGRRKYNAVLVWALDRLTREGIATLISLYNTFNSLGVKLISIQEPWTEVPSEMTPMFLAMMGFFAKWDSDRKSERVKAGLARAVKLGSRLGRPPGKKDGQPRRKSGYYNRRARDKKSPANS